MDPKSDLKEDPYRQNFDFGLDYNLEKNLLNF